MNDEIRNDDVKKLSKVQESIDYIDTIRETVLFYERNLEKIKQSREWISAMNNLRVAAHNKVIDESPSKYNNYRIPKYTQGGQI